MDNEGNKWGDKRRNLFFCDGRHSTGSRGAGRRGDPYRIGDHRDLLGVSFALYLGNGQKLEVDQ